MRMTLASFSFVEKENKYRVDYYPEGKSVYRAAVTINGFCESEQKIEGRQSLSKWNAVQLIKGVLKKSDDKPERLET